MKNNKAHHTIGQLSLPLTGIAAALFAAGVLVGWVEYLHRSPILIKHVPGTSAWGQQAVVAGAACVLFGYARWRHVRRHGRASGRAWLLAPLGKSAARRVARTVSAAPGRVPLMLAPAVVFGYCFYRVGLQVINGLDPNATVNAWGGPTYLGAMAAHYLDCAVLALVAALLLDRILLPDPDRPGPQPAPDVRQAADRITLAENPHCVCRLRRAPQEPTGRGSASAAAG
jgi:hypothetical protein